MKKVRKKFPLKEIILLSSQCTKTTWNLHWEKPPVLGGSCHACSPLEEEDRVGREKEKLLNTLLWRLMECDGLSASRLRVDIGRNSSLRGTYKLGEKVNLFTKKLTNSFYLLKHIRDTTDLHTRSLTTCNIHKYLTTSTVEDSFYIWSLKNHPL